jgi:hypothetical protein
LGAVKQISIVGEKESTASKTVLERVNVLKLHQRTQKIIPSELERTTVPKNLRHPAAAQGDNISGRTSDMEP